MAGKHRALRRRLLWTVVAASLAAAILTGCGDKDPLKCGESDLTVDVTGAADGVEACVLPADETGRRYLRLRNRSGMPVTVWGQSTLLPWPVQPDDMVEIPLLDPQPGTKITFRPDLQAGVARAVLGWLNDHSRPGADWTNCANHPDEHCTASLAAGLLPQKVEIGHMAVPVKQIGTLAVGLWNNEPLIKDFLAEADGQEGGTLILRRA
jgi:predicted small lipoprotein YifL